MLQGIASPIVGAAAMKPERTEKGINNDLLQSSRSNFNNALQERLSKREVGKEQPQKLQNSEDRFSKSEKIKTEKNSPNEGTSRSERNSEQVGQKSTLKKSAQVEKKSSNRQHQLQEFMASFESEFKISPTRLVESIAELGESELSKSPEETADAVIAKLGLPPAEQAQAKAMYLQMLQIPTETAAANLPELTPMEPMKTSKIGFEESLQRSANASQMQQKNISRIDMMNGKFWSAARADVKATTSEGSLDPAKFANLESNLNINELMAQLESGELKATQLTPELKHQLAAWGTENSPQASSELKAVLGDLNRQAEQTELSPQIQAKLGDLLKELQVANEGAELALKDLDSKLATLANGDSQVSFEAFAGQDAWSAENSFTGQNEGSEQSQLNDSATNPDALKENSKKFDEFQSSLQNFEIFGSKGLDSKSVNVNGNMGLQMSSQAEKAEATQKLINSAQLLATQGGGEMKVELNSQELGVVNLKVAMNEGKLNVEMSAQSDEAKKVLESSLAELKTSLAAQKLSMDNVKIDVVETAKNASDLQNNLNQGGQEQQQQQTRQFWNQFRNNFGDSTRGDSWSEMTGIKSYARQRDPLAPLEVASKPREVQGRGNGLNLVA